VVLMIEESKRIESVETLSSTVDSCSIWQVKRDTQVMQIAGGAKLYKKTGKNLKRGCGSTLPKGTCWSREARTEDRDVY
jgi:hypothetical protein